MTLAPPPPTGSLAGAPGAGADGASTLPLRLPPDLRLSPAQFALVCEANPDVVLELAANGQLIARLQSWADQRGGWEMFDSSTGFRLADGSVLSPDAAVVRLERWQALSPEQRRGFPPFCPDLVIELASPSDDGPRGATALRRKLAAYLANGARLGWLLLPEQQAVEICRAPSDPGSAAPPERLEGGELLPGLRLELAEIWAV